MSASVQVGRLSVYPDRNGLGQDVVARNHAETLLATLDLPAPDPLDRAVLVVRGVRWAADRGMPGTARAELARFARGAARPSDPGAVGADAVLFRDDVELLRCLTLDALSGRLSRWYWLRLAPVRSGRVGANLAAAWTERVRWLPAVLGDLEIADAVRAVSALSPDEVQLVRGALCDAFEVDAAASAVFPPNRIGDPTRRDYRGDDSPPSQPQLESSALDAGQQRLLLLALGLHDDPGTVRRAPDTPLPAVLRDADGPQSAAAPPDHPAREQPPYLDMSGGVFSRFASALYLINLASWLGVLMSWTGVELLARHVIGGVEVDDWESDPLWAILAELDGRDPCTEPADPDWSPLIAALADSALADRDIPASALMQPGRIHVTATHVDVFLDLQHIDIHVRIAGLDRDPGWAPDLARIVAFHFEDEVGQ